MSHTFNPGRKSRPPSMGKPHRKHTQLISAVFSFSIVFLVPPCACQQPSESENRDSFAWLATYFHEDMDCNLLPDVSGFWAKIHNNLGDLSEKSTEMSQFARVKFLSELALEILVPFGQPEISAALQCPMGVGVLLRELGTLLANLGFHERSLRVIHLAQTIVSFNYNNYAPFVASSKWGVSSAGHMIGLSTHIQNSLPTKQFEIDEFWHQDYKVFREKRNGQFEPKTANARLLSREHFSINDDQNEELEISLKNINTKGVFEEKPKVAIVSVCIYGNYTKLPELSGRNKRVYAALNNVELFHLEEGVAPNAHPWMNKLLSLKRALDSGRFDYVMWADCDSFFMNMKISIEDIISAATNFHHLSMPNKNNNANKEGPSLIISEDGLSLNSGIFLLKNNDWSRKLLTNTIDLLSAPPPYSWQHFQLHEQPPLMFLILVPFLFDDLLDLENQNNIFGGNNGEVVLENGNGYDPNVVVVPQRWINAYSQEIGAKSGQMLHEEFLDGDWMLSFNGCGILLGGPECEKTLKKYHDLSLLTI